MHHHQEIKTVYYCISCYALVVLAVVVCSWVVSCVHCNLHIVHGLVLPDDGHSDAPKHVEIEV